jgi:hypothetical protein
MSTKPCALALLIALAACSRTSASPPAPQPEHEHELHLPPVGPTLTVTLDGKSVDVPLASIPRDGGAVTLGQLWRLAWPSADPAPLRFDLVGSDGFRPMSRPKCTRLLTGAEIAAARIDVITHDVGYDDALQLPGCYRVKAVVRLEASPSAAPDSGAKVFGEPCVSDAECTGGVCFHKRLKGPGSGRETRDAGAEPVEHGGYCSMRCDQDTDCPVPPTRGRCGARGMCKRPE